MNGSKALSDLVNALAQQVATERGVSVDRVLEEAKGNQQRVVKMRTSETGKYRVLWVDKFDGSDGVEGEYETAEEALNVARTKTNEAKKLCCGDNGGYGVATMYYAYDPRGTYLGGDTWAGE